MGNRQQSRFLALVSSYDRLKELSAEAANSENAAQLQYLKTLDSIETKQQIFSNTIQSIYLSSGLQDFFKGVLDVGTAIATVFADISLSTKQPILAVAAIAQGFYNVANIVTTVLELIATRIKISTDKISANAEAARARERARDAQRANERIENEEKTQENINRAAENGQAYRNNLNGPTGMSQTKADALRRGGSVALSMGSLALTYLAGQTSQNGQKELSGALGVGSSALSGAALGVSLGGWKGALVGGGIGILLGFIENLGLIVRSAEDKLKDLQEEAEKANNEYLQKNNETKGLSKQIEELRELEKHMYDSTEAQEAYYEAANKMAETYPSLIKSMDEAGNVILDLNTAELILADSRKESAEAARKAAVANYTAARTETENAKRNARNAINDFSIVVNGTTLEYYAEDANKGYFYNPEYYNSDLYGSNAPVPATSDMPADEDLLNELAGFAREINLGNWQHAESLLNDYNRNISLGVKYEDPQRAYIKYKAISDMLEQAGSDVRIMNYRQAQTKQQSSLRSGLARNLSGVAILDDYSVFSEMQNAQSGLLQYAYKNLYDNDTDKDITETEFNSYLENSFANDAQEYAKWLQSIWDEIGKTKRTALNNLIQNSNQYTEEEFWKVFSQITNKTIEELQSNAMAQAFVTDQYGNAYTQDSYTKFYNERATQGYSLKEKLVQKSLSPADMQSVVETQERIDRYVEAGSMTADMADGFATQYGMILQTLEKNTNDVVLKNAAEKIIFEWDDWSLSGVSELIMALQNIGIDENTIREVEALHGYVPVNLEAQLQTFVKESSKNFDDYEKAISNATKGMDFKAAVELAEKLKISITKFRFDPATQKYFYDELGAINEAYNEYDKRTRDWLEEAVKKPKETIDSYLRTGASTSVLDDNFEQVAELNQDSLTNDNEQIKNLASSLQISVDAARTMAQAYWRYVQDEGEEAKSFSDWYTNYYETLEADTQAELNEGKRYMDSVLAQGYLDAGNLTKFVETLRPEGENWDIPSMVEQIARGEVPDALNDWAAAIIKLYGSAANDVYSSMITAIGGGTKRITVTESNQELLKQLQDQGLIKAGNFKVGDIINWSNTIYAMNYSAFAESVNALEGVDQEKREELLNQFVEAHKSDVDKISAITSLSEKKQGTVITGSEWLTYQRMITGNMDLNSTEATSSETRDRYGLGIDDYGHIYVENREKYIQALTDDLDNLQDTTTASAEQIREAKINLDSAKREAKTEKITKQRDAFKDVISNSEEITEDQRVNLEKALGDYYTQVAAFLKDNGKGGYELDAAGLLNAINLGTIELEEGVQQYVLSLLTSTVDGMLQYITNAAKYQTAGTTNFSDMQEFVDKYNDIFGTALNIGDMFSYNADLEAFTLGNEWALQVVTAQAEQVAETLGFIGEARNQFINQWIEDNYTEQLVDKSLVDNYLTNVSRTTKDRNQIQTQFEARFLAQDKNYIAAIEQRRAAAAASADQYASAQGTWARQQAMLQYATGEEQQQAYEDAYSKYYAEAYAKYYEQYGRGDFEQAEAAAKESAEEAADSLISSLEKGGQAAVDAYKQTFDNATGEDLEKAYRGGITTLQSAMKRIPELVKGSFVGTSGVLYDAAVQAGFQINSSGLVTAIGNVIEAQQAIYDKLKSDALATAAEINEAGAQLLTAKNQSTVDAITLMNNAQSISISELETILARYGVDLISFIENGEGRYLRDLGDNNLEITNIDLMFDELQKSNREWAEQILAQPIVKLEDYQKAQGILQGGDGWNPDIKADAYQKAVRNYFYNQQQEIDKDFDTAISQLESLTSEETGYIDINGIIRTDEELTKLQEKLTDKGLTANDYEITDAGVLIIKSYDKINTIQQVFYEQISDIFGDTYNYAERLSNFAKKQALSNIDAMNSIIANQGIDITNKDQLRKNEQLLRQLGIIEPEEGFYEISNGQYKLTEAAKKAINVSNWQSEIGQVYGNEESILSSDEINSMIRASAASRINLQQYATATGEALTAQNDAIDTFFSTLSKEEIEAFKFIDQTTGEVIADSQAAALAFQTVVKSGGEIGVSAMVRYGELVGEVFSANELNDVVKQRTDGLQQVYEAITGAVNSNVDALSIDRQYIDIARQLLGENAVDDNGLISSVVLDTLREPGGLQAFIENYIQLMVDAGLDASYEFINKLEKENKTVQKSMMSKQVLSLADLQQVYEALRSTGQTTFSNYVDWLNDELQNGGLVYSPSSNGYVYDSFETQLARFGLTLEDYGTEAYNDVLARWNQSWIEQSEAELNRIESQASSLMNAKVGRTVDISSLSPNWDLADFYKDIIDYDANNGRLTFKDSATAKQIAEIQQVIIRDSLLPDNLKEKYIAEIQDNLKTVNVYTALSGITSNLEDISYASIAALNQALQENGINVEGIESWFTDNGKGSNKITVAQLRAKLQEAYETSGQTISDEYIQLLDDLAEAQTAQIKDFITNADSFSTQAKQQEFVDTLNALTSQVYSITDIFVYDTNAHKWQASSNGLIAAWNALQQEYNDATEERKRLIKAEQDQIKNSLVNNINYKNFYGTDTRYQYVNGEWQDTLGIRAQELQDTEQAIINAMSVSGNYKNQSQQQIKSAAHSLMVAIVNGEETAINQLKALGVTITAETQQALRAQKATNISTAISNLQSGLGTIVSAEVADILKDIEGIKVTQINGTESYRITEIPQNLVNAYLGLWEQLRDASQHDVQQMRTAMGLALSEHFNVSRMQGLAKGSGISVEELANIYPDLNANLVELADQWIAEGNAYLTEDMNLAFTSFEFFAQEVLQIPYADILANTPAVKKARAAYNEGIINTTANNVKRVTDELNSILSLDPNTTRKQADLTYLIGYEGVDKDVLETLIDENFGSQGTSLKDGILELGNASVVEVVNFLITYLKQFTDISDQAFDSLIQQFDPMAVFASIASSRDNLTEANIKSIQQITGWAYEDVIKFMTKTATGYKMDTTQLFNLLSAFYNGEDSIPALLIQNLVGTSKDILSNALLSTGTFDIEAQKSFTDSLKIVDVKFENSLFTFDKELNNYVLTLEGIASQFDYLRAAVQLGQITNEESDNRMEQLVGEYYKAIDISQLLGAANVDKGSRAYNNTIKQISNYLTAWYSSQNYIIDDDEIARLAETYADAILAGGNVGVDAAIKLAKLTGEVISKETTEQIYRSGVATAQSAVSAINEGIGTIVTKREMDYLQSLGVTGFEFKDLGNDAYQITQMAKDLTTAYYIHWNRLRAEGIASVAELNQAAITALNAQYNTKENSLLHQAGGMSITDYALLFEDGLDINTLNEQIQQGLIEYGANNTLIFRDWDTFLRTINPEGKKLNEADLNEARRLFNESQLQLVNTFGMTGQQWSALNSQLSSAMSIRAGESADLYSLVNIFGENGITEINRRLEAAGYDAKLSKEGLLTTGINDTIEGVWSIIIGATVTDPRKRAEMLAELKDQASKKTPVNVIAELTNNMDDITEAQVTAWEQILGANVIRQYLRDAGNGNYSITLQNLQELIESNDIVVDEATAARIAQLVNELYSSAISIINNSNSGYDFSAATTLLNEINAHNKKYENYNELGINDIFEYNNALNTYFLTQEGFSQLLREQREKLDDEQYNNFILSTSKTLAGNINFDAFITSSNRGEGSLAREQLKQQLETYNNFLAEAFKENAAFNIDYIMQSLEGGGIDALQVGQALAKAAGKELTTEQITQLWQSNLVDVREALKSVSASIGDIVSESTKTLLEEAGFKFTQVGDNAYLLEEIPENLSEAYRVLWEKMAEKGTADIAEMNNIMAQKLNIDYNNTTQLAKEIAGGISIERLGEILAQQGKLLTEQGFQSLLDEGLAIVENGKVKFTSARAIAEFTGLEEGTKDFYDVLDTIATDAIKRETEILNQATNSLSSILSANKGDSIKLTRYLQQTGLEEGTINAVIQQYGGYIQDGILHTTKNADLTRIVKTLAEPLGEDIPKALRDAILQTTDNLINQIKNLVSMKTNGFSNASEMQQYIDSISSIGGFAIGLVESDLFELNEELKAYTLTEQGLRLSIIAAKAQMQQMEQDSIEQIAAMAAMQQMGKELADNIDINAFLSAEDQSVGSKSWSNLTKAIDNYNIWASMNNQMIIDSQLIAEKLQEGGVQAVQAAAVIYDLQNVEFTSQDVISIYRSAAQRIETAAEQFNVSLGSIVTKETVELFGDFGEGVFTQIGGTNTYIVTGLVNNLSDAYFELASKYASTVGANLAQINEYAMQGWLERKDVNDFSFMANAAEMSLSDFTAFLTRKGIQLTNDFFDQYADLFEITSEGNVRVKDFGGMAKYLGIKKGTKEYMQMLSDYNEAVLSRLDNTRTMVAEELNNILTAPIGSTVNAAALDYVLDFSRIGSDLTDAYGVDILRNGLIELREGANIPGLVQHLVELAAEEGKLLDADVQSLLEAIDDLLKDITDSIINGINGTLSRSEAVQLQDWARGQGLDLSFQQSADGLKLSNQEAIKLYSLMQSIDSFRATKIFDELRASFEGAGGACENISTTLHSIVELQMRIENLESSNINDKTQQVNLLKEQLGIYERIARAQMSNPDTYNFMSRSLPAGLQGPVNYWNSISNMFSSMNTSASSGYMGVQDFYNIVNELSNMAAESGKTITFMGMELDGSSETAAALIDKGISALTAIDGGEVKVNLKSFGIDFAAGASSMVDGVDLGIKGMADANIKMLDGIIGMLEVVVAMEGLEDEVGGTIDLSELFPEIEGGRAWTTNAGINEWADSLLSADPASSLGQALDQIKLSDKTLKDWIADAKANQLSESEQRQFTQLLNSFYQMSQSNDFDPENWEESFRSVLASSGFEGEVEVGDYVFGVSMGVTLVRGKSGKYQVGDASYDTLDEAVKAYKVQQDTGVSGLITETIGQNQIHTLPVEIGGNSYQVQVQFDEDGNIIEYQLNGGIKSSSLYEAFKEYAKRLGDSDFSAAVEQYFAEWNASHTISIGDKFNVNVSKLPAVKYAELRQQVAKALQTGVLDDGLIEELEGIGIKIDPALLFDGNQITQDVKKQLEEAFGIEDLEKIINITATLSESTPDGVAEILNDKLPIQREMVITAKLSDDSDSNLLLTPDNNNKYTGNLVNVIPAFISSLISKFTSKEFINDLTYHGGQKTESDYRQTDENNGNPYKTSLVLSPDGEVKVENKRNADKAKASASPSNYSYTSTDTVSTLGPEVDDNRQLLVPTLEEFDTYVKNLKQLSTVHGTYASKVNSDINAYQAKYPNYIIDENNTPEQVRASIVSALQGLTGTTKTQDIIPPVEEATEALKELNKENEQEPPENNLEQSVIAISNTLTTIAPVLTSIAELMSQLVSTENHSNNNSTDADTEETEETLQIADTVKEAATGMAKQSTITSGHLTLLDAQFITTEEDLNSLSEALKRIQKVYNNPDTTEEYQLREDFIANGSTYHIGTDNKFIGTKIVIPAGIEQIPNSEVSSLLNFVQNKLNRGVVIPTTVQTPEETTTSTGGSAGGSRLKFTTDSARAKGTLMGELGPELYVTNGHYYVAGQNGAEFVDLPDDAIVFNHLQTQRLLKNGHSGRGDAITSERAAVSYATGNARGPAMASAASTLNTLKQIRAMWQAMLDASLKDLGQQAGGGGGGGDNSIDPGYIADLERWYNLLRQIELLEKNINYEEKLRSKIQSDMYRDGDAYYKSQVRSLESLEREIALNKELSELQRSYYDARRKDLASTPYGKIFTFDENGLMQYNDTAVMKNGDRGGLFALAKINAQNADMSAVYNAEEQYQLLKDWGFEEELKYDASGKRIGDGGALTEEDYVNAVQAFWDKVDAWKDELDTLYDDYNSKLEDVLANEEARNKILQDMIDNQLSLEQSVLKAIEDREQAVIDELQKERDALEESTNKFIDGLNEQLNRERDMYSNSKDEEDLNKMRRQLAILQRTGGSASQIANLQQQISDKEQDTYFQAQQEQIEAIQNASDLQIERLDAQIDLMTETLEYQKEHGLLWAEVYEIMGKGENEILSFIMDNGKDWESKSSLQIDQDLNELRDTVQQWLARRDDKDNPLDSEDTHNWDTYAVGAEKRYSKVWTGENVAAARKAFDEEYALSADPNRAGAAADAYFYDELEKYYERHPDERPGAQKTQLKDVNGTSNTDGITSTTNSNTTVDYSKYREKIQELIENPITNSNVNWDFIKAQASFANQYHNLISSSDFSSKSDSITIDKVDISVNVDSISDERSVQNMIDQVEDHLLKLGQKYSVSSLR